MPAPRLFGTDGVRGLANAEPMTPETALSFGRAVAHVCTRHRSAGRPRILVGRDTRVSGQMLESALSAGICCLGVDVLLAGELPTPGIAFLTRTAPADAGIVVSASHNSFEDNGIKVFAATGFKLPAAAEQEIEHLVLHGAIDEPRPTGAGVGRVACMDDAAARYQAHVQRVFGGRLPLDGIKIAVDCAHGAAYRVGPEILRALGATVVAIGVRPDGENINREHGALHPRRLQDTVIAEHAAVGVALDGDADRVILIDERGEPVDGDEMLAMIAADMQTHETLRTPTVVGTVMSNMGLEVALRARRVQLVRVPVGDRYVVEEMRHHGYQLGGEPSGHLVLLDHSTTGDGLLAALTIVRLVLEQQKPLSELRRVMQKFPQVLRNVPVRRRVDLHTVAPLRQTIERIAAALHNRGRVLVRYSGTEPVIRVMVEGEDAGQVTAYAEEITAVIRDRLGA